MAPHTGARLQYMLDSLSAAVVVVLDASGKPYSSLRSRGCYGPITTSWDPEVD